VLQKIDWLCSCLVKQDFIYMFYFIMFFLFSVMWYEIVRFMMVMLSLN